MVEDGLQPLRHSQARCLDRLCDGGEPRSLAIDTRPAHEAATSIEWPRSVATGMQHREPNDGAQIR